MTYGLKTLLTLGSALFLTTSAATAKNLTNNSGFVTAPTAKTISYTPSPIMPDSFDYASTAVDTVPPAKKAKTKLKKTQTPTAPKKK